MAANFLHGVETIELNKGPVPVSVVKSAVIGLVGIAPEGPINELTLVQNEQDAAQFGEQLPGYNIPQALAAIFAQGAGTVLVINTLEAANLDPVVDEAVTVDANGLAKLAFAPCLALSNTLVLTDAADAVIATTKYTVDEYGNLQFTDAALLATVLDTDDQVQATYKKLDAASISNGQLIGAYDDDTDTRTGMKLWDEAYNSFGFTPRIIISPLFSEVPEVAAEMLVRADKYRGHALLDAPEDTAVQAAITGRGPLGDVGLFNTSSKRAVLCYPWVKAFDPATDGSINKPYSQFLAGVIASTDNEFGYWYSPSNKEIKGITGIERKLSAAINDASTDVNLLNEKGIVTIFNSFGTGLRTWGNRSAAFPSSTAPSNFICVQRTADIIHESLELAMLQFVDQPITQATIDSVRETVNGFMRTLIQRGAIIDGKCTFDKAKNDPVELAAGHLVFDLTFMPPTPAERITFDSFIDINLLKTLA